MRGLAVLFVALAFAASAQAAPPAVTASAAPATGAAPLQVTLTAAGDAASYTWDLGDGAVAEGATVTHVYASGRFTATVTATSATGETAQAQVAITATAVALRAPKAAAYRDVAVLAGSVSPAAAGARVRIYRGSTYVTTTRTRAGGAFRARIRLRSPGPYRAVHAGVASPERTVRVRPRLVASIPAAVAVGSRASVSARLVPAAAGRVEIRVRSGNRVVARRQGRGLVKVRLPAAQPRALKVEIVTTPRAGFAKARRKGTAHVVRPTLARGARGPAVRALEHRLRELRYALRRVDGAFGTDTFEAVLAFQKVHGLARTGRVDASLWRRLAAATVPRPRYGGGDHIEVDKSANVLYEILDGRVHRIVHVSTGLTGNTPLGSFRVYRKVPGWDWVLWYPMYFLRGFAIHGYPSVPAHPASHGCVRVPMWIAPSLYARHGHGARIVVYA